MTDELIKQLLEAGVHFGHQTKRWNPKMKKYIFGERSGIYIIDLEKTVDALNKARDFLLHVTSRGQTILFIGTKKQAQDVIAQEAIRAKMFFVNRRWLGGLLTNFQTIKKSIQRMKDIEKMKENGIFDKLSKKEVAKLTQEREKLEKNLSGIRDMINLPGAVFVIDSKNEETAVKEANKLGIPVVGLIDTNCDPDFVDFPIPGNDDAMKSIRLVTLLVADTVIQGRKHFLEGKGAIEMPSADETPAERTIRLAGFEEFEELEELDDKDKADAKPAAKPKIVSKRPKLKSKEE